MNGIEEKIGRKISLRLALEVSNFRSDLIFRFIEHAGEAENTI